MHSQLLYLLIFSLFLRYHHYFPFIVMFSDINWTQVEIKWLKSVILICVSEPMGPGIFLVGMQPNFSLGLNFNSWQVFNKNSIKCAKRGTLIVIKQLNMFNLSQIWAWENIFTNLWWATELQNVENRRYNSFKNIVNIQI